MKLDTTINEIQKGVRHFTRLYFTDPVKNSDKVYEFHIVREQSEYVLYGAWGARKDLPKLKFQEKGRTGSPVQAIRLFNDAVTQRKASGYTRDPSGVPFASDPIGAPDIEPLNAIESAGELPPAPVNMADWSLITLKSSARCPSCNKAFAKGDKIWWQRSTSEYKCETCQNVGPMTPTFDPVSLDPMSDDATPVPVAPVIQHGVNVHATGVTTILEVGNAELEACLDSESVCAYIRPSELVVRIEIKQFNVTLYPNLPLPSTVEVQIAAMGDGTYYAYMVGGRFIFVDMLSNEFGPQSSTYADRRGEVEERIGGIDTTYADIIETFMGPALKRELYDGHRGSMVFLDAFRPGATPFEWLCAGKR